MQYSKQIRLAIVDDHALVRKSLSRLITGINEKKYIVILEAASGEDMIAKLDRKLLPDIVMMDIEMPGMGGYEAVSWLKRHHPDIHILVVSQTANEEAIIRMFKLGVKGFISKDVEPDELTSAINAIMTKGFHYTDFITGRLINSIRGSNDSEDNISITSKLINSLTERELEFIRHACSELTYQEIADLMYVGHKTVDGYRSAVFKKLGVATRVGLVLFSVKYKIHQM